MGAFSPRRPTATSEWPDVLHWCVRVVDIDHPDLGFAASLLSCSLKYELSERQQYYAKRLLERVRLETGQ